MKTYLCIGGPLAGQRVPSDLGSEYGYVGFNNSGGQPRTKWAKARMMRERGYVLPSYILVHPEVFK